jgi:hypothetical protein
MSFFVAFLFGLGLAFVGWLMIKRVTVDPGADRETSTMQVWRRCSFP